MGSQTPSRYLLETVEQELRNTRDLTIMIWLVVALALSALVVAVVLLVRSHRRKKAVPPPPEAHPDYDIKTLREFYELTPREGDVLRQMLAGADDMSIAELLGVTLATVQGHIRHIYEKTAARSYRELVSACRMCEIPGSPRV